MIRFATGMGRRYDSDLEGTPVPEGLSRLPNFQETLTDDITEQTAAKFVCRLEQHSIWIEITLHLHLAGNWPQLDCGLQRRE
nr:hypothetical protein [Rubripirellula sp.]